MSVFIAAGCEGPEGPSGPEGDPGDMGDMGDVGDPGDPGDDGEDGRDTWITDAGVQLEITSAAIDSSGVVTVDFTILDQEDDPLDLEGMYADGPVSVAFIVAYLEEKSGGGPGQYVSYLTNSDGQATRDRNGTFEEIGVGQGTYRYTFDATLTVADDTLTHTIAAYAEREFEGREYVDNHVFHFRPDGNDVTTTREVVTNDACNSCHGQLEAHGGARQDVELCITCHQPQTVDPDTGNTTDFAVMIHKIHRGQNLPSVVDNDEPYQIIGYMGSVHDYSHVAFPQETNNCTKCHQGAQGDYWKTQPGRAACLSCHDTTSFVDPPPTGMVLHGGGAQPQNAPCNVCHAPTGSVAGITDDHFVEGLALDNPTFEVVVDSITGGGQGQQPTIAFTVTLDGSGHDIVTNPLPRLRGAFAGPNTDYARFWTVNMASSGTLTTVDAAAGQFEWVPDAGDAIPIDAEGSYTFGIEAEYDATNGNTITAFAPTKELAVTDATAMARRQVVDSAKCDNCHRDLTLHGGHRKNPQYCVMCHVPSNTNEGRAAELEDTELFIESVDFKNMIHRIHASKIWSQPHTYWGFSGPIDFSQHHFPNRLSDCTTCHLDDTYTLPMGSSTLPSTQVIAACEEPVGDDLDDDCDDWVVQETITLWPETSACTGCHDAASTQAHAEIMTTPMGAESCATCHGPGKEYDVQVVHGVE